MSLAGIAVIALGGCSSSPLATGPGSGPNGNAVNSILAAPPGKPIIDAPDMVHVGATVTISVWTMVAGCYSPLAMANSTEGSVVTLTPYSQDTRGQEVCPMFITELPQTVQVFFGIQGVNTVRAVGYVGWPDGPYKLGSVERTVVVVP
jgi:hypothetical protein